MKKKTASKKLQRCITAIDQWCKSNRHKSLKEQHRVLSQKLRGHYAYYAVPGNSQSLGKFIDHARLSWHKWLNRRCRKRGMSWTRFNAMLKGVYALPPPRIIRRADNQLQLGF